MLTLSNMKFSKQAVEVMVYLFTFILNTTCTVCKLLSVIRSIVLIQASRRKGGKDAGSQSSLYPYLSYGRSLHIYYTVCKLLNVI